MTTKSCILKIADQTNATFTGLDSITRRKCNKELKFFVHAHRYLPSVKLGRWDGCVSFFSLTGHTFINLLDRVLPIIVDAGYDIELQDNRPAHNFEFPTVSNDYFQIHCNSAVWPADHQLAGKPIELRDHQVEVIQAAIENLQSVQEVSTSAGKTIITAALSHMCQPYGRTLVIVPNKDLVRQTEADYLNVGLDVGVYFGDRKDFNKTHTICTWQSLDRITKKERDGMAEFTMAEFIQDVVCVIVDETHQAKADVLQKLLCGPFAAIPIRWGVTGTIPKEDHNVISILASLGPVVHKLAARDLMDLGILAECRIRILQMQDTVEFSSFHEENHYLVTDSNRLDWIAELIKERCLEGNTLVLVNRVETGKELAARVPHSTFVYGATKSSDRKDSYDTITTGDNIAIIASYGVAAVGINIPRIFNLILLEPGKSFIRVIQSIGRGIRKAEGKTHVDVFDVASTCKFSAKHVLERKKTYKSAQYPYTAQKVDYLAQLISGKIDLKEK